MNKIEIYVNRFLKRELQEVTNSYRSIEIPILTKYEKTLIYKYSEDGYETANRQLRESDGAVKDEYIDYLRLTLKKLPNYKLLCYRCVKLTKSDLQKYFDGYSQSTLVVEHSFVSASRSQALAAYNDHNVLFIIHSKKGKEIEKIAKFGIGSQNEQEILFISGTSFSVLEIIESADITKIYLEEK